MESCRVRSSLRHLTRRLTVLRSRVTSLIHSMPTRKRLRKVASELANKPHSTSQSAKVLTISWSFWQTKQALVRAVRSLLTLAMTPQRQSGTCRSTLTRREMSASSGTSRYKEHTRVTSEHSPMTSSETSTDRARQWLKDCQ